MFGSQLQALLAPDLFVLVQAISNYPCPFSVSQFANIAHLWSVLPTDSPTVWDNRVQDILERVWMVPEDKRDQVPHASDWWPVAWIECPTDASCYALAVVWAFLQLAFYGVDDRPPLLHVPALVSAHLLGSSSPKGLYLCLRRLFTHTHFTVHSSHTYF